MSLQRPLLQELRFWTSLSTHLSYYNLATRCAQAMEERQRALRGGEAAPPRLTTQHLYNTVNAQMAIIQAQARRAIVVVCCHACAANAGHDWQGY